MPRRATDHLTYLMVRSANWTPDVPTPLVLLCRAAPHRLCAAVQALRSCGSPAAVSPVTAHAGNAAVRRETGHREQAHRAVQLMGGFPWRPLSVGTSLPTAWSGCDGGASPWAQDSAGLGQTMGGESRQGPGDCVGVGTRVVGG